MHSSPQASTSEPQLDSSAETGKSENTSEDKHVLTMREACSGDPEGLRRTMSQSQPEFTTQGQYGHPNNSPAPRTRRKGLWWVVSHLRVHTPLRAPHGAPRPPCRKKTRVRECCKWASMVSDDPVKLQQSTRVASVQV